MHLLEKVIALWTSESPYNYDIFDRLEYMRSLWHAPKMPQNSLFLKKSKPFFIIKPYLMTPEAFIHITNDVLTHIYTVKQLVGHSDSYLHIWPQGGSRGDDEALPADGL